MRDLHTHVGVRELNGVSLRTSSADLQYTAVPLSTETVTRLAQDAKTLLRPPEKFDATQQLHAYGLDVHQP